MIVQGGPDPLPRTAEETDRNLPRSFRVLAAAFAVALVSLCGAFFLLHERVAGADADVSAVGTTGVAALDLGDVLTNAHGGDQRMLDSAFRQVERAYYKPVNAQTLLAGEQRELVAYLKKRGVTSPAIPALVATGDELQDTRLLNKDLEVAQTLYGKRTSSEELTQAAIRGMLDSLGDPYTTYLAPREIESLEESLKGGDFGGIGVYIVQDPRTKQVLVEPIEGTPAFKAGVKTGDRILSVDGHPVETLRLDAVEGLIRGKIGTTVLLRVRSHTTKSERTVPIVRQQIYVPSALAKREDGYEYIRLAEFGQTSYDEVRKAVLDGKSHGVKGYILDLRNNGGGLLEAAVSISSLFIKDGTIVSTIDRAGDRDTKTATHESVGAAPLVILVNKFTASASEITAGAVQDYKVGTLIGTKTFGKGVVQSIYNTSDGGALKITTAKYVTPLGRDIQHKGIEPDVYVDQAVDAPMMIDTPKDLQLAAAKSYLRRIARR
jgi:carboxyl-terminal processing protease